MTFFRPDTCNCVLEIDELTFNYIDWIRKCEIHKIFTGRTVLDEIMIHSRSYNWKFGKIETTEAQDKIINDEKRAERQRITLLGKGVTK